MAYIITDACVDERESACVEVCPVDCIAYEDGVDRKLYIDPDVCTDCGACEPACPIAAIFADNELPANQAVYRTIDATWYVDRAKARAEVNRLNPR